MVSGLGGVASGVVEGPITIMSGLLAALSLVFGVVFLLRGMVFLYHSRRNPEYYPVRQSWILFLMSGVLFALLFLYGGAGHGNPPGWSF